MTEQTIHLRGWLEVPFGVGKQELACSFDCNTFAYACENVLQITLPFMSIERIVHGKERYA
jgi:hypothetical protein